MNKRKKVLIVDDSVFMRTILKDIVSQHFPMVDVIEANGAKSALDSVKNQSPDLVLLDVVMNESESEGVGIMKKISKIYSHIPVIMITSVGNTNVRQQCASLGARGYIQKPFDDENIIKEMNKYL